MGGKFECEGDAITDFLESEIQKHTKILKLLECALESYIEAGEGLWLKERSAEINEIEKHQQQEFCAPQTT